MFDKIETDFSLTVTYAHQLGILQNVAYAHVI